jgi:hypothetical protein
VKALRALQPFAQPRPAPVPVPRCELCGTPIENDHPHVVDVEARSLHCACRGCALLFTNPGAGRGKYRTAPDRWLHDSTFRLGEGQWNELRIPVRLAFFFRNTPLHRWVAFYPGPAGAAESLLGLETWEEVARHLPIARALEPDVEALLIFGGDEGFECFLVPIHACYELVGRVKLHWKGFDGGEDVRRALAEFFGQLRTRCRPLRDSDGGAS